MTKHQDTLLYLVGLVLLGIILSFIFIGNSFAYTIEVKTIEDNITYENVSQYKDTEDYFIIYFLNSFDNYRVMIRKSLIVSIKIKE
jgi:hypothetical protein